jgi:hypothetical protein
MLRQGRTDRPSAEEAKGLMQGQQAQGEIIACTRKACIRMETGLHSVG